MRPVCFGNVTCTAIKADLQFDNRCIFDRDKFSDIVDRNGHTTLVFQDGKIFFDNQAAQKSQLPEVPRPLLADLFLTENRILLGQGVTGNREGSTREFKRNNGALVHWLFARILSVLNLSAF